MDQVTSYVTLLLVWQWLGASSDTPVSDVKYPWFPNSSGLEYHNRYCKPDYHEDMGQDVLGQIPKCFPCFSSVTCKIYGTFCPDEELSWAKSIFDEVDALYKKSHDVSNVELINNSASHQDFERFNCVYLDSYREDPLLIVDECPQPEKNTTLRDLCIQNLTDTVRGYTPVTNVRIGVTYRNTYCHQCSDEYFDDLPDLPIQIQSEGPFGFVQFQSHGDSPDNMTSWELKTMCEHYQTLYHITLEDEFFRNAFNNNICSVELSPPSDVPIPESCSPDWYHDPEPYHYTSCQNSDPKLLWYCLHIKYPAFRTTFRRHSLFCMLCEGQTPTIVSGNLSTGLPFSHELELPDFNYIPPISLLLGLTNKYPPEEKLRECSITTWLNDKGECQEALCSPGKETDSDGICASVLTRIRGLGYTLSLTLVPEDTNVSLSKTKAWQIKNEIFRQLLVVSTEIDLQINIAVLHDSMDDDDTGVLHHLTFTSHIISTEDKSRDEFETDLLSVVTNDWVLTFPKTEDVPLRLIPKLLGTEFSRWYNELIPPNVSEVFYHPPPLRTRNKNAYLYTTPRTTTSTTTPPSNEASFIKTTLKNPAYLAPLRMEVHSFEDSVSVISHKSLWGLKNLFIDLTNSLICPFVTVNVSALLPNEGNTVVSFLYNGWNVSVNVTSEISLVDGKLSICLELFKNLTRGLRIVPEQDPLETVQYYVEIVCISLSVACLLLSFLTYCLFPTLRSLPGLNNMTLCVSLATAHICLIITSQHGVHGQIPSGYCTFHAICLHYFWLVAILWMNACCVHMYRVFTCHGTKFTDSTSNKKRYLRYCVFTFGTPVPIIILTVILNWFLTSGESFGYDDTVCFLDVRISILTVALSLLAPLCLMVICNGILFFLTIREIFHVTSLQEDRHLRDRHGVMAYVKLSTLTGIFCVVCVVAVQLQNPVLNIFVSPFMALQGVFIFFSFIFNKRVGKLYSDSLSCCRRRFSWPHAKSSTSGMMASSGSVDNTRQSGITSATNTTRI